MRIAVLIGFLALFGFAIQASASDSINWTFYAPGAGGWIEGPMTSAYPDASGKSDTIHTLDDVRNGLSPYVTLASASSMKGRWYCIGTVTYTSPQDRQTHTLQNVVGYVQDTGCAFNGTCSCSSLPQYCNGMAHPEKMDIAIGNFTGWSGAVASTFITKNPNTAPAAWQQISGPPSGSAESGSSCGGTPIQTGTPIAAAYNPNNVGASAANNNTPGAAASPVQSALPYAPQTQASYVANTVPSSAPVVSQPLAQPIVQSATALPTSAAVSASPVAASSVPSPVTLTPSSATSNLLNSFLFPSNAAAIATTTSILLNGASTSNQLQQNFPVQIIAGTSALSTSSGSFVPQPTTLALQTNTTAVAPVTGSTIQNLLSGLRGLLTNLLGFLQTIR